MEVCDTEVLIILGQMRYTVTDVWQLDWCLATENIEDVIIIP